VQLHPTRSTFHVALAGAGLIAVGAAARLAPVVAFGGAMLLAVAIGRAMALLVVTRLRAAGFEMVWTGPARVHRVARGASVVLPAELRNHGLEAVRAVDLRPIASSMLDVRVEPATIDLPPGARASVDLVVRARRVGRWGVHGLALEVRAVSLGGEGLYEVPLLFTSPVGVEVLPPTLAAVVESPRGGRSRRAAEVGRTAASAGEADELRELRDHAPGDPFKRIAWKASARRGRLLVREMEREERDVVWLVVDASVELWAGPPGHAPLDHVVDDVAARAARHLARGNRVGLVVFASRLRSWIAPNEGAAHAATLAGALASAAGCVDADRSELDEAAVARRVTEHASLLDPRRLVGVRKGDLDTLAARVAPLRARAPFAPRVPFAPDPRERALRQYMAAFGIESPPRVDGERERAEATLGQVLDRIATDKPRASVVHVWAPAPARTDKMAATIALVRRRRVELRWTLPPFDAGVGADPERSSPVADVVDEAVRARARVARARAERLLRRLGVRLAGRSARRPVAAVQADQASTAAPDAGERTP
jgi:uncharacterized protein (DUF58 family)